MKVLIVNTSETAGGAALAARRLGVALAEVGVEVTMLVMNASQEGATGEGGGRFRVEALPCRWRGRWHFLAERLRLFVQLRFRRENLFALDPATHGTDITRLSCFREADVVHLHWTCQGMLSLDGVERILRSGKAVVWTMHDLWAATGLCHVALSCRRFTGRCHRCQYLPGGGSDHDLAARRWERKRQVLLAGKVSFVACSEWLAGEARRSGLLGGKHIVSIPNAIDTTLFCLGDRRAARRRLGLPEEGRLVLFVAQKITNPNKGMSYFAEACRRLAASHPEESSKLTLVAIGGSAGAVGDDLPVALRTLGYISEAGRMADAYRAADVFVLPSLSENLPNTIMEAMASGVPCVGFEVGGIPEEIDHRENGYVARYRDAGDLAEGLRWTLFEADTAQLGQRAREKVMRCYTPARVAQAHLALYSGLTGAGAGHERSERNEQETR